MHSDRPYVTVSQGLAIVPALQRRLAATQIDLRRELPEFIGTRIAPLIERRMDEAANRIAELVAVGLFDGRIEPILRRFRQEGGSVADLKSRLAEDAAAFRPQLEAIVTTQLAKVLTGVAADTTELMQDWYRQHRLTVDQGLTHAGTPVDMAEGLRLADLDVYRRDHGRRPGALHHHRQRPGGHHQRRGRHRARHVRPHRIADRRPGRPDRRRPGDALRNWTRPSAAPSNGKAPRVWLLARALSDTKIARLRDDLKGQVADKVTAQSEQARQGLEDQISERVEQEIASLSAISQIW